MPEGGANRIAHVVGRAPVVSRVSASRRVLFGSQGRKVRRNGLTSLDDLCGPVLGGESNRNTAGAVRIACWICHASIDEAMSMDSDFSGG